MRGSAEHFEDAFENWLRDNQVEHIRVDQHKRAAFSRMKIKSFDFLVYPRSEPGQTLIIEVKGRRFEGASLYGLRGLQCWVTLEDVRGLSKWEEIFGKRYSAAIAFVYELAGADVELDGRRVFEFDGRRYFAVCVRLGDYMENMRQRSAKWQTVSLGAMQFRKYAVEIDKLLL